MSFFRTGEWFKEALEKVELQLDKAFDMPTARPSASQLTKPSKMQTSVRSAEKIQNNESITKDIESQSPASTVLFSTEQTKLAVEDSLTDLYEDRFPAVSKKFDPAHLPLPPETLDDVPLIMQLLVHRENTIREFENQVFELKNSCNRQRNMTDKLTSRVAELESKLLVSTNRVKQIMEDAEESKNSIKKERDEARQKSNLLEKEILSKEEKIAELEKAVEINATAIKNTQKQCDELIKQNANELKVIYDQSMEKELRKASVLERGQDALRQEISVLKSDLHRAQTEKKLSEAALKNVEQQKLSECERLKNALRKVKIDHQLALERATEELSAQLQLTETKLRAAEQRFKDQNALISQDCENLRELLEKRQTELDQIKRSREMLMTENNQINEQLIHCKKELEFIKKERDGDAQSRIEFTQQLELIQIESAKIASKQIAEIEALQNTIQSLLNSNNQQSIQIESLEDKLKSNSILFMEPSDVESIQSMQLSVSNERLANALKTQINSLNFANERMTNEIYQLTKDRDENRLKMHQMQEKYNELHTKFTTVLELLGEREEEIDNLKNTLTDARAAYQKQIIELVDKMTLSKDVLSL